MKLIYSRYYCTQIEECASVSEGFSILDRIENNDDGFAIGVWDDQTGIFYQQEQSLAAVNADNLLRQKIYTLKAHGIIPKEIKIFKPSHNPTQ